jgi:protocatechuate 3,4-dioxygenase beta subunit
MAATPPCDPSTKPTPARTAPGFRAGAPMRLRLIEGAPGGRELVVTGAVIGLRCGFIPGATVDVWHADAQGVVNTAGTRWRGRQLTDAGGRFRVETIVPGAPAGQAPRLNLRVHVPGKATLTTMMFLPELAGGARNPTDKMFDPLLAMTLIDQTSARVTASFNVILDL